MGPEDFMVLRKGLKIDLLLQVYFINKKHSSLLTVTYKARQLLGINI